MVDGRLVVGELARHAGERHLRDIVDGESRGIYWRPELKALNPTGPLAFLPAVLPITAGAKAGQPFDPLPWHMFFIGSMFGWVKESGRLRFRSGWAETGKGQAKALDIDTPIATPSGWTTMGGLTEGDLVFDECGNVCRVLRAHPISFEEDCYRLTFDDGAQIVANGAHLWQTEMRKSGAVGHGEATKGVPLARRGAWRRGIRTTREIAATLTYKNGRYQSANHSVDLCRPVVLPAAELPVHPYVLGVWLGDGDSDCARVTIGDRDSAELVANLAECGVRADRKFRQRYGLGYGVRWGARKYNLGSQIRALGLFGKKRIPEAYLRGSIDQRLAVLQGLMDTDGTVSVGGQCSFCNTNEALAQGALDLALSLGLKATFVTKTAVLNGRPIGQSYHVNFYAPGDLRVFRLSRKQVRVAPAHARRRLSADRKIVACEKVGRTAVRCITVDSPSSLFLAGRQLVPTHNSPMFAAVGLYMMGWYGVPRAEVYSIGQSKATANVLFKDAAAMCQTNIPGAEDGETDTLESRGEVIIRGEGDNAWQIEHPTSKSKFKALANGEAVSGPRPICVAADEIHEFKTNTSLEMWQRAIAKMPGDGFMLLGTNTPASTQLVGTEYSTFYQRIARGEFIDDEHFSFIARVDKADQDKVFDNEACWQKALPALGITFPVENIRGEVNTARERLSTAMSVKRLYFGIPLGVVGFWMDEEPWAAVQAKVDPAEHKGEKCWLSLDLSKKNDLTALSACWKREADESSGEPEHLFVKTWYWTVKDGLADRARRDVAKYVEWAADPEIDFTAVPGATIDKTFAAAEVAKLVSEHEVQFLAFDVAGMADFISACETIGLAVWKFEGPDKPEGYGLKLVPHNQGKRRVFEEKQLTMPTSIEKLEDHVLDGAITIDDSPVTYMCAANAIIDSDGQANRCFDKAKSRGRIDGIVTTAMAVGAAVMNSGPPPIDYDDLIKNAVIV